MCKILIFGAGSIGTYLALKLSAAGNKVTAIGGSKLKGIKEGDTIKINAEEYKMPEIASELVADSSYDYIFITCKLYDIRTLLKELKDKKVKFNVLVSIQNSLFDDMWYYEYIRDKPFVILSVFEAFNFVGKEIKKADYSGRFAFVENDILGKDIVKLFNTAKITVDLVSDLRKVRGEKTVFNCAVNALGAIENKTFKELISDRRYKQKIKAIFDESYDILSELVKMKAKRMLWQDFVDRIKNMNHYSSTWQDVKASKKTEVAFLNGYIVNLGKTLGKPTTENLSIVEEFRKKYPGQYYVQI